MPKTETPADQAAIMSMKGRLLMIVWVPPETPHLAAGSGRSIRPVHLRDCFVLNQPIQADAGWSLCCMNLRSAGLMSAAPALPD